MLDESVGQEYLDLYDDRLDFSEHSDRRTAVFALENFYGRVMAEVGEHVIQFQEGFQQDSLAEQWERIDDEFAHLADESDLRRFGHRICESGSGQEDLKGLRNRVYHEFDENVSEGTLDNYRSVAPEFREWLLQIAQEYQNRYGLYSKNDYEEISEVLNRMVESEEEEYALRRLKEELEFAIRMRAKVEKVELNLEDSIFDQASNHGFTGLTGSLGIHQVWLLNTKINAGQEFGSERISDTIEAGLEVLEHLYKSQSPFEHSSLYIEEFEDSLEERGYEIVDTRIGDGEIDIVEDISFGGVEFPDCKITISLMNGRVTIWRVDIIRDSEESLSEEEKQALQRADCVSMPHEDGYKWSFRPFDYNEASQIDIQDELVEIGSNC